MQKRALDAPILTPNVRWHHRWIARLSEVTDPLSFLVSIGIHDLDARDIASAIQQSAGSSSSASAAGTASTPLSLESHPIPSTEAEAYTLALVVREFQQSRESNDEARVAAAAIDLHGTIARDKDKAIRAGDLGACEAVCRRLSVCDSMASTCMEPLLMCATSLVAHGDTYATRIEDNLQRMLACGACDYAVKVLEKTHNHATALSVIIAMARTDETKAAWAAMAATQWCERCAHAWTTLKWRSKRAGRSGISF
jgi:hypothetical protein